MKTMAGTTSGGVEREQLKSAKIAVLKLINDHKDILFGKASDNLTRETKEAKWAEVADHAHELGAFPWHRSWDYLKDTTWQNWRKRFVEKREKKDKFEKMGLTSKILYDEADLLIMDILDSLGRNGPSAASLAAPASLNSQSFIIPPPNEGGVGRDISDMLEIEFDVVKNETDMDDDEDVVDGPTAPSIEISEHDDEGSNNYMNGNEFQIVNDNRTVFRNHNGHHQRNYLNMNGQEDDILLAEGEDVGGNSASSQPKIIATSSLSSPSSRASILRKTAFASLRSGTGTRKRPASSILNNGTNHLGRTVERELMDLKCRKIRAELELLHRESYKKDLEILQLERSLGLPASHVTKKFYKYVGTVPHGIVNNSSNH